MKLLEERIIQDGTIKPGGVLKVDNFLNHQIDTGLLYEMACEWKRLYVNCDITKILTIEASGIGLASMTGYVFGCPVLFAKKSKTTNISSDVYSVEVPSFTHKTVNTVMVSREYHHLRKIMIDEIMRKNVIDTGKALAPSRMSLAQTRTNGIMKREIHYRRKV